MGKLCLFTKTENTATPDRQDWRGFLKSMAETTETTPSTSHTLASIRSTSVFPVPVAEVHQREDGMVSICIGDCCGLVSSWHLVEPKELQLIEAYRKHHDTN